MEYVKGSLRCGLLEAKRSPDRGRFRREINLRAICRDIKCYACRLGRAVNEVRLTGILQARVATGDRNGAPLHPLAYQIRINSAQLPEFREINRQGTKFSSRTPASGPLSFHSVHASDGLSRILLEYTRELFAGASLSFSPRIIERCIV